MAITAWWEAGGRAPRDVRSSAESYKAGMLWLDCRAGWRKKGCGERNLERNRGEYLCNGPQKLDRAISLCITCNCHPEGSRNETTTIRRGLQGANRS
jgi:hypothetical protein